MFHETYQTNTTEKQYQPEELSELTFDEIYDKLGLKEPEQEDITDLKSYMRVQREVMQALIDKFHNEDEAIKLFQEKLSQEFANRYRKGF